jgi:hypothetical protein
MLEIGRHNHAQLHFFQTCQKPFAQLLTKLKVRGHALLRSFPQADFRH